MDTDGLQRARARRVEAERRAAELGQLRAAISVGRIATPADARAAEHALTAARRRAWEAAVSAAQTRRRIVGRKF